MLSTTKCVREYLEAWAPGEEKLGYEICDAVKCRMRAEGKRPLESTIMRRVREAAAEYGISSVNLSSRYVKEARG